MLSECTLIKTHLWNPNTYFEFHFPLHDHLSFNLLYRHYKKLIKCAIHPVLITNSLRYPLSVETLLNHQNCMFNQFSWFGPKNSQHKAESKDPSFLVPWFTHQIYINIFQVSWALSPLHTPNFHISSYLLRILLGCLLGNSNSVCRIYSFCSYLCFPTTALSALLFMSLPLLPFIH